MEPMDVDCMDSEFDNKENTYHNNMLPCTEKGYEELDVSELNMKLRYSITPAASPMSKSYTAYRDHETDDRSSIENNLTRSLNSTMSKHDSVIKSLKTLPLQSLPTDELDSRNSSVLRPLDTTITDPNNITVTISQTNEIDENLSLPSTSSSVTHTPEATTPVHDEGSPIMRGLKTVLNMFRPSQSPIPPEEGESGKPETSPTSDTTTSEKPVALASTPIAAHRRKDGNSSKRSSPLKDSIVFNDDLEKELLWKDETTIIFSQEKIPIHKLFYQNAKPTEDTSKNTEPTFEGVSKNTDIQALVDNMNTTVECMDVSYNNSTIHDKTLSKTHEEDEFVDCETTLNNESHVQDNENSVKDPLLEAEAPKIDVTHSNTEKIENIHKDDFTKLDAEVNVTQNITIDSEITQNKEVTTPESGIKEDTDSTISIIQELDSLLEGNDTKKENSTYENNLNTTTVEIPTENITEIVITEQYYDDLDTTIEIGKPTGVTTDIVIIENHDESKEIVTQPSDVTTSNKTEDILKTNDINSEARLDCVQTTIEPQDIITAESEPEFVAPFIENQSVSANDRNANEVALEQVETPADVPLPDEDEIDTELIANDTVNLNASDMVQIHPDVIENVQTEGKLTVAEHLEKSFSVTSQDANQIPSISLTVDDNQIHLESGIQEDVLNTTQIINNTDEVLERTQCIPHDTEPMDINGSIIEGKILPVLVNQTIPIENASNLHENKDEHNIQPIKDCIDVRPIEDPLIQKSQNMPVTELPVTELNIPVSEITDLYSEIETIIVQAEDVANTTNEADSTVTLDDQTVNTENNIIVGSIEDNITTQENNVNSTVVIDNCTNQETLSTTVLVEDSKDVTQEIISADNKEDVVPEKANITSVLVKEICSHDISNTKVTMDADYSLESATDPDNQTPIQENEVNSTVTVDDNKDIANATVMIDEINNVGQGNAQTDNAILPNIDPQLDAQNLDDIQELPTDIEIIVSENNSPYVSVMAGIDTEPKLEDNFETLDFSRLDVPSSPPIVSKGYNFNFDEIEEPFATKTNIRLSPPPTTPSKDKTEDINKKIELPKKAPNRRKSQPPERKIAVNNKKKLNTTINVSSEDYLDKAKPGKETINTDLKVESAETTAAPKPCILNEGLEESNTKLEQVPENNQSINLEEKDTVIKIKEKALCDSSSATEVKTTSSSESYFSAAGSSTESFISKNVFNIPEIDDSIFNPFATKSKMRESPPLVMEENPFATISKLQSSPDSSMVINEIKHVVEDKMDVEMMEKDAVDTSAESSSKSDEKNVTPDVNTEDEDTEEGPFLEAEEAIDKTCLANEHIKFNSLPPQNDNILESGEVFIDAEAFEFFLNQNQSNMVADSGKESLFLKFDPLFAKRISSDGIVAALKNVQKRQSTPTKTRPTLRNEASPIAGPSNLNTTFENDLNASQESNDEANITVAKPTMIVTPAVNPVVTPRNKSITPNRSNRRSFTFTSPAMAVIDRLISMSSNNSFVDTTMTQPSRDQHEADVALSQLRELLAEKEINVYNLKAESMLLKERLATMESQVKTLEDEGQNRLKKINELNSRLLEKSEINKRMAEVVEEYERTIASLIAETEQDKKRHAEERIQLIKERDEQTAHLASMEASFSDLHSKYEKSKQVILSCKANEETYKKSINDFEESLKKMQNNYEMLKQHATSKLNHANQELEKMNKAHEAEVLKLNALLKRKELHITSLEESLALKTKANDELTAICDELINKVG